MKRSISPAVTVIVVILVIVIAGLLWYIFSTPRAEKGARPTMLPPVTVPAQPTPAQKAGIEEAKAKAAEAQQKLRAEAGKGAKPAPPPGR